MPSNMAWSWGIAERWLDVIPCPSQSRATSQRSAGKNSQALSPGSSRSVCRRRCSPTSPRRFNWNCAAVRGLAAEDSALIRVDAVWLAVEPLDMRSGTGAKARTGRLWVYVRDDRTSGDAAPPAVWFQYSPDRKGGDAGGPLKYLKGILQADAYAGYHPFYEGGEVVEAACWSHARRKMWDIHERQHKLAGTLAHQALQRIGVIFQIEAQIRGKTAQERWRARQERTQPALQELKAWLNATLAQVSAKSPMAMAIGYTLSNWTA